MLACILASSLICFVHIYGNYQNLSFILGSLMALRSITFARAERVAEPGPTNPAASRVLVRFAAPLLWLDAACVAREEAGPLELLPLLVSGCQRFLILAGPTYANRRAGGGRETCLESAPSPTLTLARGRASQALVRG